MIDKLLEKFFDALSIIATLTILFAGMVVGFICLGLPVLWIMLLISVFA